MEPRLTLALRVAFYAVAAVSLALLIATVNEVRAFDDLMGEGGSEALRAVAEAERISGGFTTLVLWVGAVTAVLTIVWWYRAYSAVEASGARGLRWSRGWAAGGWLIPFANFVIAKLVLDEIDRVSRAIRRGASTWRDQPTTRTTAWWWGTWIGGLVIGVFATTTLGGEIEGPAFDPGAYRTGLWALAVTHAASTAAAFLAAASIRQIGERIPSD